MEPFCFCAMRGNLSVWSIMNVFKISVLKKKSSWGAEVALLGTHTIAGDPSPVPAPTPGCGTPVPGEGDLWPPRELAFTHTYVT